MNELDLTITELRDDYMRFVFKYPESTHSGVLANANSLAPGVKHLAQEFATAAKTLAQYADSSITAYRALKWWDLYDSEAYGDLSHIAREQLRGIQQPTSYMTLVAQRVDIESEV